MAETMRSARLLTGADARLPGSPGLETGSVSTTGSGSGLRDQAAEPALALLVFADRRFERGTVEVGPIDRQEHQFAIGRLPEQEVRQALFAAGADNEIGIGQIGRVEECPDRLDGDVGRMKRAALDLFGDAARRARDFLAGAVIERDHQSE